MIRYQALVRIRCATRVTIVSHAIGEDDSTAQKEKSRASGPSFKLEALDEQGESSKVSRAVSSTNTAEFIMASFTLNTSDACAWDMRQQRTFKYTTAILVHFLSISHWIVQPLQ
jgi:hypothetical protein